MLRALGLIATIAAGFGLGGSPFTIQVRAALLTAVLAVLGYMGVSRVLPHQAIEQLAESQRHSVSGQLVVMGVAVVETAGLLIPVALMPWTTVRGRAWVTLHLAGAAFLAIGMYYFLLDVVIANGETIGPPHPSYEFYLVLSLPLGAIGYAFGWLVRRLRGRHSRLTTEASPQ